MTDTKWDPWQDYLQREREKNDPPRTRARRTYARSREKVADAITRQRQREAVLMEQEGDLQERYPALDGQPRHLADSIERAAGRTGVLGDRGEPVEFVSRGEGEK